MSLSSSRNIYLVIFFVLVFSNASIGWDCPPGTPEQSFASSDIVFEGKVVYEEGIRSVKSADIIGVDVTFEVTKSLKGNLDGLVKVRTGTFGFTPGYPFLCGEDYVVPLHYRTGSVILGHAPAIIHPLAERIRV